MYKLLLTLLLVVSSLAAKEIHWAKDFKTGIAQAQQENKPVLFIISRDTCRYCILLEDTTLQDEKVISILNKDYIAIRSWTNENDFIPENLHRATPGLPGIWFLYADGSPMYQPILGYKDAQQFLQALTVVNDTFNKENKKRVKK